MSTVVCGHFEKCSFVMTENIEIKMYLYISSVVIFN